MADDNVKQFTPKVVVSPPGEPNPKVINMLKQALERALQGDIEFAAVVAMPSDGGAPLIAASGLADPYRVIGALMHGVWSNLLVTDAASTKTPID